MLPIHNCTTETTRARLDPEEIKQINYSLMDETRGHLTFVHKLTP